MADAATGQIWKAADAPCLGIEYLWNNKDVWVNLQDPLPSFETFQTPAKLSFELSDCSKWETLFHEHKVLSFPDLFYTSGPSMTSCCMCTVSGVYSSVCRCTRLLLMKKK